MPAISPDGSTLLFSWQGDIWSVPRDGGTARRLTVNPAVETAPKWTPDGSRIVFASTRYGAANLFSMNPDGTGIQRLTYDSAASFPTCVSPDGKTIFGQTAAFSGGRPDLFRIPIGGGDLVRLTDHPLEQKYFASVTPDGKSVVYNRGAYGVTAWKKPGVHSSALPAIWIADNTVPLSHNRRITKDDSTNMFPLVGVDGSITFVSNRSGWPNLWRMKLDGSGAKQLTQHVDGTMRDPAMTPDGRYVVYEFESDLYLWDAKSGQTKKLAIQVPDDARSNSTVELNLANGVTDYAVAPDGKRAVVAIRGQLFLMPEKGGVTRRLAPNSGIDYEPEFIDAHSLLFARSDSGKRDLATVNVDGVVKPFLSDPQVDLTHARLSPDGKTVAFHHGLTAISAVPTVGGDVRQLVKGNFVDALTGPEAFSWSPDSKYLVVAKPTDRGTNVTLVNVETGVATVVAWASHGTSIPRFLPNGRGVYFTADEYGTKADLFVVDLLPDEPTFAEDELDKIDAPKPKKSDVRIEFVAAGIERRMRRLTANGAADPMAAPDSKHIWASVEGHLVSIPVAGGPAAPVVGESGPALEPKLVQGKLYFLTAEKLQSIAIANGAVEAHAFSASTRIDLKEEDRALFDEIWWAMDRLYYDDQFHGKNWVAIKAKYSKIVPACFDRTDFYNLMGEMMEELDSSHLGSTAPMGDPTPNPDRTGYLGIDLDPAALDARGERIVASVLAGSPADNPVSRLKVGDKILAVNGIKLDQRQTLAWNLNETSGKRVTLTIDRGGKTMDVVIKPGLPNERSRDEYVGWVEAERARVDQLSNGQIAYFHIEAMSDDSFDLFLRQIRTQTPGKKAAIVDVRYNGGGSTSHKVLGVLIKTPWLIRTTRGPEGIRLSENIYRGDSLELPSALLFNSSSFSNAEIMGEGFRQLKRGPIVGEKTPGYVIGTGAYRLWDGGFIRMPMIGCYTVDGQPLENVGRKPDYEVPYDPDAWTAGRDPQLERAVQELMKAIK